jgi:hypothetical protein
MSAETGRSRTCTRTCTKIHRHPVPVASIQYVQANLLKLGEIIGLETCENVTYMCTYVIRSTFLTTQTVTNSVIYAIS